MKTQHEELLKEAIKVVEDLDADINCLNNRKDLTNPKADALRKAIKNITK